MRQPLWLRLDDPTADVDNTGGKGAALATMARAGLQVPPGFHITTAAYREFTDDPDVHQQIRAIVTGADVDDPDALADASRRVRALLEERAVPESVVAAIVDAYTTIDNDAVAVRSSATAEDLADASFAGQLESFLNVRGLEAVTASVKRCWMSLWSAGAIEYRARTGLDTADLGMAVVVQELVDATASGVMFTADPVTGDRDRVVINAAWGLGESIVGGTVPVDTIIVDGVNATIIDRNIADKAVKTVSAHGTNVEAAVPSRDRTAPALDDDAATRLAALGARVVQLYRRPMDIEWALSGSDFAILQARPITNLPPVREVWNDSRTGDFLWTSANVAEAVPNVMTPITWDLSRHHLAEAMVIPGVGDFEVCGNIGGRLYINYSVVMGAARAIGMGGIIEQSTTQLFGQLPEAATVPGIPMRRWKILRLLLPTARRFAATLRSYQRHLDTYVAEFPGRCARARTAIAEARDCRELAAVWTTHCEPLLRDAPRMLAAGGRVNGMALAKLRPWLARYVDNDDANALLSGTHTGHDSLESMGPLMGLRQLVEGSIDRDTYIERWGHRCRDELELYAPRPVEDPHWLDRRLSEMADAPDVGDLLERQTARRRAAKQRFTSRYPSKAGALQRRMTAAAQAIRARETTRSEAVRSCWVARDFLRRARDITGHGDDVFFLHIDELLALLDGDDTGLARVPARRAAYEHYRQLPVYPTWIRGSFDPDAFAADPDRSLDWFDANAPPAAAKDGIVGTPGSTGTAEGTARVIADMDQSHRLNVGDILVTKITNIGWTPVFPRLGAVVTDIGATLSHAAIVARALGLPAVVGCGDATVRIRDGDRIRVNGGDGTVAIVSRARTEP